MKILKRNNDGLVVSSFSDSEVLIQNAKGTFLSSENLLLWEYTDENSIILDDVTLPVDYADFKYFYNDDGEFVANDDYPLPPEIARQNEETEAEKTAPESAPE